MYIIDKIPEEVMGEHFSEYCSRTGGDKAGDGGVFVITKDGKPSGALLSIGEFEDYKAMKNKQYLDKLDESWAQIQRGEVVKLSMEQLKAFEFGS